jgi:iron(III)-salmochelin esterase
MTRDTLGRRAFLVGAGASLAFGSGCSKKEAPPITSPLGMIVDDAARDGGSYPRGAVRLVKMRFDATPMGGPSYCVCVVPAWGAPGEKFPVLVALHGHGESLKSPEEGAMGWPRDYALTRAFTRACAPPLTRDDYEGFVSDERLAEVNNLLNIKSVGGLIVASPFMPDGDIRPGSPGPGPSLAARAEFVTKVLLPRVQKETPALVSRDATGIDGVSFGGALSLRIGLTNPDVFGAVGAIQPAIGEEDAPEYVQLARIAREKNPQIALRLMTSVGDYFRPAVEATSAAWREAGITHDFLSALGPHDYAFNRGPGSIEMLLFHDRVLAHHA